jgi:hypothetical protein
MVDTDFDLLRRAAEVADTAAELREERQRLRVEAHQALLHAKIQTALSQTERARLEVWRRHHLSHAQLLLTPALKHAAQGISRLDGVAAE